MLNIINSYFRATEEGLWEALLCHILSFNKDRDMSLMVSKQQGKVPSQEICQPRKYISTSKGKVCNHSQARMAVSQTEKHK